jgi:hypothetical protein
MLEVLYFGTIIEISYIKNVERIMNLRKIILQIGTLSFCTSIVIFALFNVPAVGIINLSFLVFIIATGVATYHLVKRFPPPKEEEKKPEPETSEEEEIISEHVISIDRVEVPKTETISEIGKDKKESKKSVSETETPTVKE